jgi:toxin ParE1/3/4
VNRFRLSRQAEQDLEDIWVYLAQQDELLADKQIAQILDRFPMLSQFPDMGRQRDDLLSSLRSFPIKPYIIF